MKYEMEKIKNKERKIKVQLLKLQDQRKTEKTKFNKTIDFKHLPYEDSMLSGHQANEHILKGHDVIQSNSMLRDSQC